jgi:hypothetical protein
MKNLIFPAICLLFWGIACTEETPAIDSHACDCSNQPESAWNVKYGILFQPKDSSYPYSIIDTDQGSFHYLLPICSDSNFLNQLAVKGLTGDSIPVKVDMSIIETIECEYEGLDKVTIGKAHPLRVHTIDRQ